MVNYHENVYMRRGVDGRSHIPAMPFWMAIVRVVQLLFAFLVMVLAAYADATFSKQNDGTEFVVRTLLPGYSMTYFTFAWTILFFLYIFLTPLMFPKFYHSYAHLGLEFVTIVFWLTTFALLADETKWWDVEEKSLKSSKKFCDQYSGSDDGDACGEVDKLLSASKASKAATAFAALTWLLFMVTFGFLVYYWNKHRQETRTTGGVEAGHIEKNHQAPTEMHNVQGQGQYTQQQQYPQQTQYAEQPQYNQHPAPPA